MGPGWVGPGGRTGLSSRLGQRASMSFCQRCSGGEGRSKGEEQGALQQQVSAGGFPCMLAVPGQP